MISVGVIGASGYTGFELLNILERHGQVELKVLNAHSHAGKRITELYPHYRGKKERYDNFSTEEIAKMGLNCVFLALPNGIPMKMAPQFLDAGTKVIDLSADYRFKDPKEYEAIYKIKHEDSKRTAVYGLPELFRQEIKNAELIANPGCYATVNALCGLPLTEAGITERIIFDAESGYSGAGREKTEGKGYQDKIKDNILAYNIISHRHLFESRQFLGKHMSFTPHVLQIFRGMMTTAHLVTKKHLTKEELIALYKKRYANEPFVKIVDYLPDLHEVQNNNYCVIGGFETDDTQQTVIIGVIDNLLKGASGQAVQNMNIMFGFDEKEGFQ